MIFVSPEVCMTTFWCIVENVFTLFCFITASNQVVAFDVRRYVTSLFSNSRGSDDYMLVYCWECLPFVLLHYSIKRSCSVWWKAICVLLRMSSLWHDQELWVGCRRYLFEILAKKQCSTPFVLYCFSHWQILHNCVTRYPILMGFASKCWSYEKEA